MKKNNSINKKIQEIVYFIVHHLDNLKMIVLFGSMAKKGEGNDIDLAIITASWEGDMRELDLNIGSKIRPICQKYPIDYFVIPLNLVEKYKKSPLLKVIDTTGRLLYMDRESIDKWISDARLDYGQSCYLFKGGYFKGACYSAQQAIEKLLKSKLLHFGWKLQKVHSIVFLVSELKHYNCNIHDVSDDELSFIDSIYRGRYPGEEGLLPFGDPTKDDAQKAISIARRIENTMGKMD